MAFLKNLSFCEFVQLIDPADRRQAAEDTLFMYRHFLTQIGTKKAVIDAIPTIRKTFKVKA